MSDGTELDAQYGHALREYAERKRDLRNAEGALHLACVCYKRAAETLEEGLEGGTETEYSADGLANQMGVLGDNTPTIESIVDGGRLHELLKQREAAKKKLDQALRMLNQLGFADVIPERI